MRGRRVAASGRMRPQRPATRGPDMPSSDKTGVDIFTTATTATEAMGRLEADLAGRVDGEVRFDAGTRGAYSTDGSNFRQVPIGVVLPRTVDAAAAAVAVCREHDVPLLSRGGGTSLAGQCTNTAVVLDWSKYCNQLLEVDPANRTCAVEPGIVLDALNNQLGAHGLSYGPEPATHLNCTHRGDDRQQLLRRDRATHRQGRGQYRCPRGAALRGHRFWCGPTDRRPAQPIQRRGDHRARSTAGFANSVTPTPGRSRSVIRISRDGSRVTTSTPCYLSTASMSPGCSWAASPRSSPSCTPKLELLPVLKQRALVVLGFPMSGRRQTRSRTSSPAHSRSRSKAWTTGSSTTNRSSG